MSINPIDAMQELAVSLPVFALTLVGIAVLLSRLKSRISKPKTSKRRRRFRALAEHAALGLAFLPFAAIYRPQIGEVAKAQLRQQEDVDEDDNGDPDRPARQLLRQLRRIRRGEEVEILTLGLD